MEIPSTGAHAHDLQREQYALEKTLSLHVDTALGLDVERTEVALRSRLTGTPASSQNPRDQLWLDRDPQVFLTPYWELERAMADLDPRPGERLIDLGAGYGRLGFVLAWRHAGVRFIGYEIAPERCRSGNAALLRAQIPPERAVLVEMNLENPEFRIPAAEFYFIYDFGTRRAIEQTLIQLKQIASTQPITVVARGRASRDGIEQNHPWLCQVVPPFHRTHYSIYRSSDSR